MRKRERQLRSRARAVLSTTCDVQCAAKGVWLRTQVYLDLGWPLLGMEKHEAAAQLVSQNAAQLPQAGSQLRSAGNDVAVLHAWIRAAAGDHAAASGTLAASVDHDRASSSLFNELQSLVDLAYFAEMAGDEVLATRRRDDLRQRARAYPWTGCAAQKQRPTGGQTCVWMQNCSGL